MIHIMHMLGEFDAVGGTTRLLLALARHSDPQRIKHSFVCMRRGALQAEFEQTGAAVKVVDSTSPLAITRGAIEFGRAIRADVVSTHFTRSLVCGAIVARMLDVPFMHNEHGAASGPFVRRSPIAVLGWFTKRRALRSAGAIVCNSRFTASSIISTFGVERAAVQVMHLAVERRAEAPVMRGLEGPLKIGHVGGMIPLRRQATLIRALRLLRDRGRDAQLILVGDGPLREELEKTCVDEGVRASVTFRGYQTDLAPFYGEIDVFASSAVAEGFGVAIVEAMLAGIPVVLANAGSHAEIIEHGRTGLLFPPDDYQALADAIESLARDREGRLRFAKAGQEYAESQFIPTRYATAYGDVAAGILNRSTPAFAAVPS